MADTGSQGPSSKPQLDIVGPSVSFEHCLWQMLHVESAGMQQIALTCSRNRFPATAFKYARLSSSQWNDEPSSMMYPHATFQILQAVPRCQSFGSDGTKVSLACNALSAVQGISALAAATRTFISSSAVGINAVEFGTGIFSLAPATIFTTSKHRHAWVDGLKNRV